MRRHSRSSAGFIAWIREASIWWTYNLTQPPNCISRMTEETRPEISLLSKQPRSEERRVGKESVSTWRSRRSRYHYKKTRQYTSHNKRSHASKHITHNHT